MAIRSILSAAPGRRLACPLSKKAKILQADDKSLWSDAHGHLSIFELPANRSLQLPTQLFDVDASRRCLITLRDGCVPEGASKSTRFNKS